MNSKFFTLQSFTPRTVFKFLDRSTLYSQRVCLPLNHSHQSLTLTSNPHSKMNPRNSFRNAKHKQTSADANKYIVMLHYDIFSGTRPGTCPVPNPIPTCESTPGCVSDDGCSLGERCCLQWNCTKTCVKTDTPSPPPLPPLPGGTGSEYKQKQQYGRTSRKLTPSGPRVCVHLSDLSAYRRLPMQGLMWLGL